MRFIYPTGIHLHTDIRVRLNRISATMNTNLDPMSFHPFPHIGNFRKLNSDVEKAVVQFPNEEVPYRGTVKIHGTNAAVSQRLAGGELSCQSRNRLLHAGEDNFGFSAFMDQRRESCDRLFSRCRLVGGEGVYHVFGEFAGQGIQKGMAVSAIPKFFVIFAVCREGDFMDLSNLGHDFHDHSQNIYNVFDFGQWTLTLKRSNMNASDDIIKEITAEICAECPAGRFLGASGNGEGIVWQCLDAPQDARLWFKSKGDDGNMESALRTPTESCADAAKTFADVVVTPDRVLQGIVAMKEAGCPEHRNVVAWVVQDALREEGSHLGVEDAKIYVKALRARSHQRLRELEI